jgi:hypothetical protein
MTRDSNPLLHLSGSLFLAARAFAMLTSRARRALSDLCPGPVPPIPASRRNPSLPQLRRCYRVALVRDPDVGMFVELYEPPKK